MPFNRLLLTGLKPQLTMYGQQNEYLGRPISLVAGFINLVINLLEFTALEND
jgi:hypothetical protein